MASDKWKMMQNQCDDKTLVNDAQVLHSAVPEKIGCPSDDDVIQNWGRLYELTATDGQNLFTPKYDKQNTGGAAFWIPMSDSSASDIVEVNEPPIDGALLGSKDGKTVYRVMRLIGRSASSSVFSAIKVNANTLQNMAGNEVAIKFIPINSVMYTSTHPKRLSTETVSKLFAQYIVQRSYGGCVSSTVRMYDAFVLAIPASSTSDKIHWFVAVVTEKMDGNILDLVNSHEFKRMSCTQRCNIVLHVACKIVHAVFELELQGLFHDNIRPTNFLYRKIQTGCYEIKITDFDLGSLITKIVIGDFFTDQIVNRTIEVTSNKPLLDVTIPQNWQNLANVRFLMRCMLKIVDSHRPPEYDLVNIALKRMHGIDVSIKLQRAFDPQIYQTVSNATQNGNGILAFLNKNIYNTEWLSRMSAFALAVTVQDLFTASGFSMRGNYHNVCTDLDQRQKKSLNTINKILNYITTFSGESHICYPLSYITTFPGHTQTLCASRSNYNITRPTTGNLFFMFLNAVCVTPDLLFSEKIDHVPSSVSNIMRSNLASL